jgi:hypothetical protein
MAFTLMRAIPIKYSIIPLIRIIIMESSFIIPMTMKYSTIAAILMFSMAYTLIIPITMKYTTIPSTTMKIEVFLSPGRIGILSRIMPLISILWKEFTWINPITIIYRRITVHSIKMMG